MVVHPASPVETLPQGAGITADLRDDGAVLLRYHGNTTSAEEVLAAVHAAGISIRDVKTAEADLEDVFLALTKSG
jgi:ABC-2 type transport system ATP-binding protein